MSFLTQVDPEIAKMIGEESSRQQNKLELIASENFTSEAVMEAQGSVLTNKYVSTLISLFFGYLLRDRKSVV